MSREEWVFWAQKLSPQKFSEEKPTEVPRDEWIRMKKRFGFRRLKEVRTAYERLSHIVLKVFAQKVRERLNVAFIPTEGDMREAFTVVKTVTSVIADPEEQHSLLLSLIDQYISLYPSYGHERPSVVGLAKTLRRNPAFAFYL